MGRGPAAGRRAGARSGLGLPFLPAGLARARPSRSRRLSRGGRGEGARCGAAGWLAGWWPPGRGRIGSVPRRGPSSRGGGRWSTGSGARAAACAAAGVSARCAPFPRHCLGAGAGPGPGVPARRPGAGTDGGDTCRRPASSWRRDRGGPGAERSGLAVGKTGLLTYRLVKVNIVTPVSKNNVRVQGVLEDLVNISPNRRVLQAVLQCPARPQ